MPTAYMPTTWRPGFRRGHPGTRTDHEGSTLAFVAATRKIWGSGLPRVMSSSWAIAANRPSRPHSWTVNSRLARAPLEPESANRTPAPRSGRRAPPAPRP